MVVLLIRFRGLDNEHIQEMCKLKPHLDRIAQQEYSSYSLVFCI
jgi:hypothetical protein